MQHHQRMHTLLCCAFFVLFSFSLPAQTPDAKPVYISISYIKTNPGKTAAYLDLQKAYSKKINEYYFKQGKLMGVYLCSVVMPSGSSADYDIASVAVSGDLNFLLNDTVPVKSVVKKLFPEYSDTFIESIFEQYRQTRTLVKRDIFRGVVEIAPDAPPTKFATMDFMKTAPGKEDEYVKLEKEFWMPIHKERIKMGVMVDWLLMEKIMPLSSTDSYNYVTGNFFTSMHFFEDSKYMEGAKKAFPNTDVDKKMEATSAVRTIAKEELWELEFYVDATNTKK